MTTIQVTADLFPPTRTKVAERITDAIAPIVSGRFKIRKSYANRWHIDVDDTSDAAAILLAIPQAVVVP